MTTTTDVPTTVARYLDFWNADPGDDQRRRAVELFAPDVDYVAPIGTRHGIDELLSLAGDFVLNLGDLAFLARAQPDVHNGCARLRWELIRGNESFAEGTDVLFVDDAGRVTSVTTFLDRAPEGFDPHAHD